MKDKLQEGLESLDRIRLLIGYSLDKTLTENKKDVVNEQINNISQDIARKLIKALSGWFDDDEVEALKQIRRIDSKEILNGVNQAITKDKGVSLSDYLNDEMSDIDVEYGQIFNHLVTYDSSYQKGYKGDGVISKVGKVIDNISKSGPTVIESPNGVVVTGPYRTEDNVLWKGEKMLYTQNGQSDGYFIIKNNTKTPITINSVTSTYEQGKVLTNFFKTPINSGGQSKVFVSVKSEIVTSFDPTYKPEKNSSPVDNTYVAPKYKPEIVKKELLKTKKQEDDILTINTNLGNIKLKLKFDYTDATKAQVKALDNWQNGLSVPGGYRVIEGISPFEYDEFLGKVKNLSNQSGCKSSIGGVYNKLVNGEDTNLGDYINEQSVIGAPSGGVISKPTEDEKVRWGCQSKLKEIFNEYSNRKFPKGITKEDLKDFNTQKETVNKEILNWQNAHKKPHKAKYWTDEFGVREKIQDEGYYFDEKLLTSSEKEEYKKLKLKIEELEQYYGYDGRSDFDKFMDSGWGQLAQFGAIAALMIAGFFTEGATWIVAADLLLNISLGTYYASRGNTREALMYFIFAGMGQLHKLYNVVNNSVKTVLKGSELSKVSASIASKMAGITFDSAQSLNSFMYGVLDKGERAVFREVLRTLKTQPQVVQESLEGLSKEVAQSRNVYKNLSWYEAQKMSRFAGTKKFLSNMVIDLAVTIPAVEKTYDVIKTEFKKKGVDITWGERDHKILEYISQNKTQAEIKNLEKNILYIFSKLEVPELKYYANELNKIKSAEEMSKYAEKSKSELDAEVKKYKDLYSKKKKEIELEKQKIAGIKDKAIIELDKLYLNEKDWKKIPTTEVRYYKFEKKCQVGKNSNGDWFVKIEGCNFDDTTTTTTIK